MKWKNLKDFKYYSILEKDKNSSTSPEEIEFMIINIQTKKILVPYSFIGEFYKYFKEELIPILHKYFQKNERGWNTHMTRIFLIPKSNKYIPK